MSIMNVVDYVTELAVGPPASANLFLARGGRLNRRRSLAARIVGLVQEL